MQCPECGSLNVGVYGKGDYWIIYCEDCCSQFDYYIEQTEWE